MAMGRGFEAMTLLHTLWILASIVHDYRLETPFILYIRKKPSEVGNSDLEISKSRDDS